MNLQIKDGFLIKGDTTLNIYIGQENRDTITCEKFKQGINH